MIVEFWEQQIEEAQRRRGEEIDRHQQKLSWQRHDLLQDGSLSPGLGRVEEGLTQSDLELKYGSGWSGLRRNGTALDNNYIDASWIATRLPKLIELYGS